MNRWEYRVVGWTTATAETEKDYLDEYGKLGWELVNVLRNERHPDIVTYYFKRPITKSTAAE